MKFGRALLKKPIFRFVMAQFLLFALPAPIIYLSWKHFGEPRDYALLLFILIG